MPAGITALTFFFMFGAAMGGLAAVMLRFPGCGLDPLWRLNPRARDGFAAMGEWAVLLMAVVCVTCGTAALGLLRCKRWGYWTALVILTINLAGDTAQFRYRARLAHPDRTADWRRNDRVSANQAQRIRSLTAVQPSFGRRYLR